MPKKGETIFHRPNGRLDKVVSLRLPQEVIDLINDRIDIEHRTASEIIRDAVRYYVGRVTEDDT